METLYYKVFSADKKIDEQSIFTPVLEYSKQKYGERYLESALCWQELIIKYKKITGKNLKIDQSAQNILGELKKYNLSISHSNGVCAFAFIDSKSENLPLAIDVECVSKKVNERLLDFLNLPYNATETDFYTAWTKYECTFKALGEISAVKNLKRGERYLKNFVGNTFIREFNGKKACVSIFNDGYNLEELK